jgi:mono/diheme cytochrome c family protein
MNILNTNSENIHHMNWKSFAYFIMAGLVITGFISCGPSIGNNTGHEYMMDMGHSIAFEANTSNYYKYNTWGTAEEYHAYVQPRIPVRGTIARGYASLGKDISPDDLKTMHGMQMGLTVNGAVPYYYMDTEEDRERASREILRNPFPISDQAIERGMALYNIYCAICHGGAGDGNGYLLREDGGKYPAQPANLISDDFIAASEGRLYHSLMYGKNVMGPYADKLSFEERWDVIHYIRSLQAKSKEKAYSSEENTLNTNAVPLAKYKAKPVEN